MNIKDILEEIPTTKLWLNGEEKWITVEDLENKEYFLIYGDDRGDTFVYIFKNEKDLLEKVQNHVRGYTNCDFETRIYLIVKNGIKQKINISLENF